MWCLHIRGAVVRERRTDAIVVWIDRVTRPRPYNRCIDRGFCHPASSQRLYRSPR
jgi:hypothetical protein